MPYQAKDIHQKRERTISFPLNKEGDELAIKWSPANLNQRVWDAIYAMSSSEQGKKEDPFEWAEVIAVPLITWWDIQDGDEMWPITAENIASFGLDFVTAITKAIQEDWKTGADIKKGSGGG